MKLPFTSKAAGLLLSTLISVSSAQAKDSPFSAEDIQAMKSGGETTVRKNGSNAFSLPAANLPLTKRLDFSVGNSFFRNPWVQAPATTDARDGLGLYLIPMVARTAILKMAEATRHNKGTATPYLCWSA